MKNKKIQKDFDRWNENKKGINNKITKTLFHKREMWWCAFGVNIGREQDGRHDNFERPVVIVEKLSPDTFIAVPLSTKQRMQRFQSLVTHDTVEGFALLDQMRVLDAKRLIRKIGTIGYHEYDILKEKLHSML